MFIDLTKAFDLVCRSGLFVILKHLGCQDTLLSILMRFHEDMKATVQHSGSKSRKFAIHRGVKQGCVLAPTLFGIYFSALLHRVFPDPSGLLLHTRSSGKFLTSPASVQELRSEGFSSVSSCMLMTLLLLPTPKLSSKNSATLSAKHARSLA